MLFPFYYYVVLLILSIFSIYHFLSFYFFQYTVMNTRVPAKAEPRRGVIRGLTWCAECRCSYELVCFSLVDEIDHTQAPCVVCVCCLESSRTCSRSVEVHRILVCLRLTEYISIYIYISHPT